MGADIESIVRRHTVAMGGARAVESMGAVEIRFSVVEPTFAAEGIYAAERRGRMRVDVFVDEVRVFSEGHDGSEAWKLPQGAESGEPASLAGTRALLAGIDGHLLGLHELTDRGYQLQLDDARDIDGQPYYVIEVQTPYGRTFHRFVHAQTWLIERTRERKALHPDVDPTETVIETLHGRFERLENGVLRPFEETQTDLETGKLLAQTTVRSIDVNPLWSSAHFEPPKPPST